HTRFRRARWPRDTNETDKSARDARSRRSTNSPSARTVREASARRRPCGSTSIATSADRVFGIRLDDLAHEAMADHVHIGQVVKPDAVDAFEDALDLDQ